MKIMILGANGMIGHQLWFRLNQIYPSQVWGTIRKSKDQLKHFDFFSFDRILEGVEASNFETVSLTLNQIKPDVVINCIGITLRKPEIRNVELCLEVNAMFPRRLAFWAQQNNARLIHLSTDCVFDGKSGSYSENSPPTATDIYGKTKFLGEPHEKGALTLRVPVIGREIEGKTELVEWVLFQKNKQIKGYSQAMYSGITSLQLSKEVIKIIQDYPTLSGLIQISSQKISKFELLGLINKYSKTEAIILKDEQYVTDKSLDSSLYRKVSGWKPPHWDDMIKEMFEDRAIIYDK